MERAAAARDREASAAGLDKALRNRYDRLRRTRSNDVVEYSKTQMEAMVKGYNAVKRVGFSELLRSNPDNPTTPPSDEAVRWGLKGAEEGERDRISCNPKATPPIFTVPLFLKKKTGYRY